MKFTSDRIVCTTNDPDWQLDKGKDKREYKKRINFAQPFEQAPVVQVALAHLDILNVANTRIGVDAFNIDKKGFDLVFQTWADTQIAGLGVVWFAYGE